MMIPRGGQNLVITRTHMSAHAHARRPTRLVRSRIQVDILYSGTSPARNNACAWTLAARDSVCSVHSILGGGHPCSLGTGYPCSHSLSLRSISHSLPLSLSRLLARSLARARARSLSLSPSCSPSAHTHTRTSYTQLIVVTLRTCCLFLSFSPFLLTHR